MTHAHLCIIITSISKSNEISGRCIDVKITFGTRKGDLFNKLENSSSSGRHSTDSGKFCDLTNAGRSTGFCVA